MSRATAHATIPISCAIFERLYRHNNRVDWDWARMRREDWPVEFLLVTSRKELQSWVCPWYLLGDREVHRLVPGYSQVHLKQLSQTLPFLEPRRLKQIEKLTQAFHRDFNEISFPIALLERAGRPTLLVDGCHRVSALLLCPSKKIRLAGFSGQTALVIDHRRLPGKSWMSLG